MAAIVTLEEIFQPTLPARGATRRQPKTDGVLLISTHAPRTGSDDAAGTSASASELNFNPRSPHGERRGAVLQRNLPRLISTHAPRTGSDMPVGGFSAISSTFQPTLPARGATPNLICKHYISGFQPTLPARGATSHRHDEV